MKTVVTGLIAAILFFAAGALAWSEAKFTRRLASEHQRLATLRYDTEEEEPAGAVSWMNRLPWPLGSNGGDVERNRATIAYWLSRYESLTEMTDSTRGAVTTDPSLLLLAANAQYRSSAPQSADRKAVVERLDVVLQSYADVLRRSAGDGIGAATDAAFNYEYVAKVRDALAKAARTRDKKAAAPPAKPDDGGDLPGGPTLHGRPGGPPEGTDMSDFKTISPMRYDEREEQMEPGKGSTIRRKG